MPALVNSWRGILRGNLRTGSRVAGSIIRYHEKHDPDAEFLTDTELAQVVAFQDLCKAKLQEKHIR